MNKPLGAALYTTLVVPLIGVSTCSNEKERTAADSKEVMVLDRGDDAAELARNNGPEAEDMAVEETAPMITSDALIRLKRRP